MIRQLFIYLIDFLLPTKCITCSSFTNGQSLACGECWPKLHFLTGSMCKICGLPFAINAPEFANLTCPKCLTHKPPYNAARSLLKFDDIARKLIHHFKYYDKTHLAKYFADMFIAQHKDLCNVDLIIPVPMHKIKRLFRLYNPPQILAKELAKKLQIPCRNDILLKGKLTKSQTSLSRKERLHNLKNSFLIKNSQTLSGKTILLIDDVMTTGTTINLCAKILKKHGARKIHVFTIAMNI